MLRDTPKLEWAVEGAKALVLTGSGSSEYAGACLCPALQRELQLPTDAIAGGAIVMHGADALPPLSPICVISLARSGNSPESTAAVRSVLDSGLSARHLIITCNSGGKLATTFRDYPLVTSIVLDDRTNDRSLVMTSSFTNMVIAGRLLGGVRDYFERVDKLARAAEFVLSELQAQVERIAGEEFDRVVFLGSGGRFASARESALKMLEMTGGRVITMAETWLGVRHGPMSAITRNTLVVCFLSNNIRRRAFELDLVRELEGKQLGRAIVIFGAGVPEGKFALDCEPLARVDDDDAPVLDVMVGQLLAYYRCLAEGLDPDNPSAAGVISRVVQPFPLHGEHA